LSLAGSQEPTKASLPLPLLRRTGERKYSEKLVVKIRAGRHHSSITVMGKTDLSGEISLIYFQSEQRMLMRNKTKS